jgi:hypothetical protein
MARSYDNAFQANLPKQADWHYDYQSDFSTEPLSFLVETILATQEYWETLPGLSPLFLREALDDLLEATP